MALALPAKRIAWSCVSLTKCVSTRSRRRCVLGILLVFSCLWSSVSTSGQSDQNVDENKENRENDGYLVPPLPEDAPFPILLHERDVIRHMTLGQNFLNIGGGAHARISLAEIRGWPPNRLVVVKTFKGTSSFNNIVMEARIHRYLESLNITPLLIGMLPSGSKSSNMSLVFEFIPFSHSLHDWMKPEHQSSLSTCQWLDVCLQLIRIIRLVHSYDVIFNDLHRGNVVIQKKENNFRVFIIDFGLATYKTGKNYHGYGSFYGYTFLAPEAKSHRTTTQKSDIYSIGIILRKMALKLNISKLLPLAQWCSAFDMADRPSLDMIDRRLKDLFLEQWIASSLRSWPEPPDLHSCSFNPFSGEENHLNSCQQDGVGIKPRTDYRSSGEMGSIGDFHLGDAPIWTWLADHKPRVSSRCPIDMFVLDFHEILLEQYHRVLHSSELQSIVLTGLNSPRKMVVLKQFHSHNFALIREEACVTAILGKLGVAPKVIGILPGPHDEDLNEAAFVQEYYGAGISLATFFGRVKFTQWDLDFMKRVATDSLFEVKSVLSGTCYECCHHTHADEFWEVLNLGYNTCPVKSLKQRLFERVAMFLTRAVMVVHRNGFLLNNLNQHNVLVQWNHTSSSLDVNLIDLNRVSSLVGIELDFASSYLSSFPYIAPEVVRGGRSSEASDAYSLCYIIQFLLADFMSASERKIRKLNLRGCDSTNGKKRCGFQTSHWSKSDPVDQSQSCLQDNRGHEYIERRMWQKLEAMFSNCLGNLTKFRPSLQEILDIITDVSLL